MPGFKKAMQTYLSEVEKLSYEFTAMVAEALGLGPAGLGEFFDNHDSMQHRCKVVRYPSIDNTTSNQGVGPHFDAGFLTFVGCNFLLNSFGN
jgi:isopenicillin N synthase-like dioxygenase